uniref:Autophagy-related protein 6 n=1 Tax=Steinernema glaseri TaxID=37863 RepID=A0A1I8AP72_9BILA
MTNSPISEQEPPEPSPTLKPKTAKCMICQSQIELTEECFPESQARELSPSPSACGQLPSGSTEQSESDVSVEVSPVASRNLFDIICNSKGPFQTPMCKGCTDSALSEMDVRLKELDKEFSEYSVALAELEQTRDIRSRDSSSARCRLEALKQEESELMARVERLDAEDRSLTEQMNKMNVALKTVNSKEEEAFGKLRNLHRQLLDKEEEEQSLTTQQAYIDSQLAELVKMNVLNFAFHIWINGKIGTINGFRLGRLPDVQVEWHEINAALGQAALLLHVMNKRMGVKLDGYEIVPLGAHSCIRHYERDGKVEELPLYGTGGIKLFGQTKLDRGLVAFLECFCHLSNSEKFKITLPHEMNSAKGSVKEDNFEYYVRLEFNALERWTNAMKCLLMNLKWAISVVALQPVTKEDLDAMANNRRVL